MSSGFHVGLSPGRRGSGRAVAIRVTAERGAEVAVNWERATLLIDDEGNLLAHRSGDAADAVRLGGGDFEDLFGERGLVAPDPTHTALVLSGDAGVAPTQDVLQVWDDDENTNVVFDVDAGGQVTIREQDDASLATAALRIIGANIATDKLAVTKAGTGTLLAVVDTGAQPAVVVGSPAFLRIDRTTAPDDAAISASQLALWFDDTNGAAKLMIKGKTANGTVVEGEVALS